MTPDASSPFDALAANYDRLELENDIRRLMRERSLDLLDRTFAKGARLLDVGCGTGTEAVWLAQRGRDVTACDSSASMLEALRRRALSGGVDIPARLMRAGELVEMARERTDSGEAPFDGAYSSFGALNTESSLDAPVAGLSELVRPGGRIVLGIMNRWCVSETVTLLAAGRPRDAFRRHRRSLIVDLGATSVEVRYPSWPSVRRALRPHFRILRVEALLFFLLPYQWRALRSHRWTLDTLARLDRLVDAHRPFAWGGDHVVVVAERRPATLVR